VCRQKDRGANLAWPSLTSKQEQEAIELADRLVALFSRPAKVKKIHTSQVIFGLVTAFLVTLMLGIRKREQIATLARPVVN
jgi:hypothetical protein